MSEKRSLLQVKNVNAWFGDLHVVKDINADFYEKSITAIIGPSGCGKSSFIRCINRLHEEIPGSKFSGEVILEGKNIYAPKVDPVLIRQSIGMVFQRPNPFPSMSIYDNVIAGLKLSGVRKKSILNEAVEKSLKKAALWSEVKDKLHHQGTSLSGGQQQRLCIARAIAINPPIILMDEPTSALDPIASAKIEELMLEIKEDFTVITVTHNMQQASRISDYTCFFVLGNLVEQGKSSQIFTNPKESQTQDYISGKFG